MRYIVTFSQYHSYSVEADNEIDAFDKAHDEFIGDMRRSVASTWYNEVCVDCDEDDEQDKVKVAEYRMDMRQIYERMYNI